MNTVTISNQTDALILAGGFESPEAVKEIRNAIERAQRIETQFQKENKLHTALKLIRRMGKTVFFPTPVSKHDSRFIISNGVGFRRVDDWIDVKQAKLMAYQPRKKLLWLQLAAGDLRNSQYKNNYQPMTLKEAVEYGLELTKGGAA